MHTASVPPSTPIGFSQLVTGAPAALPTGTRPEAMAPATAPRKNGVTSDERAKDPPYNRWRRTGSTSLRSAKPEPRRMMPTAARVSGMYRVDMIEANAGGKQVHSTTRTKMSQTWLVSQTGPMDCSMSTRWGRPRSGPPASRSQNPPPKSAPPSTAYAVMPTNSTTTTTSAKVTARPLRAPGRPGRARARPTRRPPR